MTTPITSGYTPTKKLMQLKGKWYLETKHRIEWFRQVHPRGTIDTRIVNVDPLVVRATIYDEQGAVLAVGHGTAALANDKAVWAGREVEKAETAAIGRALEHAGFGTTQAVALAQKEKGRTAPTPSIGPVQTGQEPGHGTGQPGHGTGQPGQDSAGQPGHGTGQPGHGTGQPGQDSAGQPGQDGIDADLREPAVMQAFTTAWLKKGVSFKDLKRALNVDNFVQWDKGLNAANAAVNEYLVGRQQRAR